MNFQDFLQQSSEWLATSGLRIALILVMLLIGIKTAGVLSTRLFNIFRRNVDDDAELKKRADTLSSIIRYALNVALFIVSAMMILREIGIDIGPILAAAGVLGLAVGFGAQNLVKDVISGFFILLEDQIRVGDVVSIAGKGGLVERITLRMVVLRDEASSVHYIRNGEINVITNMTKEYSHYVLNVQAAYREDYDEVVSVLRQIDQELRSDVAYKNAILEPLEVWGLDSFGDSAIIIKARIKTKPIMQWMVGREFNRRMKKRFDELNIEIPFPHRTLYWGKDKQGRIQKVPVDVNQMNGNGHETDGDVLHRSERNSR